jgi:hypothetical protein
VPERVELNTMRIVVGTALGSISPPNPSVKAVIPTGLRPARLDADQRLMVLVPRGDQQAAIGRHARSA